MTDSPVRQPSAIIPIAMSGAALATIGCYIAMFGTDPQPDEGAAAHLWQLLMAGQVPVVAFYALRWLPRAPKTAILILAAQFAAALAALAPVYFLRW